MKRLPFPVLLRRTTALAALGLLAGCSLLGGGAQRDPVTIHAPRLAAQPDPSWPQVQWQLAIARPIASRLVDSPRMAVRPVPGELQVYRGSAWAQPATDMIEGSVLRVLEESGKITGVGRLSSGMRSDYRLLMDLRRFEADYRGGDLPVATIEVSASLIDSRDQRIVGRHTFLREQLASTTEVASVASAFDQALASIASEIAGWTLVQGQADAQARPRP